MVNWGEGLAICHIVLYIKIMELKLQRWRSIAMVFPIIMFSLLSSSLIGSSSIWVQISGWVLLILVVQAVLFTIRDLVNYGTCIVIDEEGITVLKPKTDLIRWGDIHFMEIKKVRGYTTLCLWLENHEAFLGKLSKFRQQIFRKRHSRDLATYSINLAVFQPSSKEVEKYLNLHHSELFTQLSERSFKEFAKR